MDIQPAVGEPALRPILDSGMSASQVGTVMLRFGVAGLNEKTIVVDNVRSRSAIAVLPVGKTLIVAVDADFEILNGLPTKDVPACRFTNKSV